VTPPPDSGITVDPSSTATTLVLTGAATTEAYQATLRTVAYASPNPTAGLRVFTFTVSDGTTTSEVATTTINVTSVNVAPVANDDIAVTAKNAAKTITVLVNDTDADGDPLTVSVVTGPGHGSVIVNADGTITYSPAANYTGTDSFTYKANDGTTDSNAATVNITVTAGQTLSGGFDSVYFNEDGSRAFVVAKVRTGDVVTDTSVVLIDTATGAALGAPVTFDGDLVSVKIDGSRGELIATTVSGDTSQPPTTTVTLVNVFTGGAGATRTLVGTLQSVHYGTEMVVITETPPAVAGDLPTTRVTVLNGGTLAVNGTPFRFDGEADSLVFSDFQQTLAVLTYDTVGPDDKVVVINVLTGNASTPLTLTGQLGGHPVIQLGANTVGVLTDTITGGQPSTTLNVVNVVSNSVAVSSPLPGRFDSVQYDPLAVGLVGTPDEVGPRAVITRTDVALGDPVTTTTVTILNPSTGTVLGKQTITGDFHELVFNQTSTHTTTTAALLTYTAVDGTAQAVIVNTTTGAFGAPITLAGSQFSGPVIVSADGTRFTVITTTTGKGATTTITTIDLIKGSVL
jgi:hypothetical protein